MSKKQPPPPPPAVEVDAKLRWSSKRKETRQAVLTLSRLWDCKQEDVVERLLQDAAAAALKLEIRKRRRLQKLAAAVEAASGVAVAEEVEVPVPPAAEGTVRWRLLSALQERGLKWADLAAETELPAADVEAVLGGERRPTLREAAALAGALRVPLPELAESSDWAAVGG